MARTSVDAHAFLNPPSPAFTNPDLILPFDGILGLPVSPPRKQPPSPPDSDRTPGTWNHGTQLNYSMPLRTNPSSNGLGTALSIIEEIDTTPKRTMYAHPTNGSSPTLKNSTTPRLKPSWEAKHDRRWSNGSGSVHSDDIENMHWPDFEGPSEVDEESVVLEDEEEQLGSLPKIADSDDLVTDEQYLSPHVDSLEDDPLSRRADMILANAKKRLHAMEGNLRGARNSLLISAPSSPSSTYFSPIVDSKERPRYPTATGIYGQRTRNQHISNLYVPNLGHNRMTSDSSSVHFLATAKILNIPKRSSSALGSFAHGLSSLDKSAALRGVRSQQDMRDSRLQSWIEESSLPPEPPRPVSSQANLPHSRSPSMETTARPGSAASSLRFQMDELKGRIKHLKAKAHEDRAKRLSSVGSRTPSPFVATDKWYNESETYRSQSLDADAGAGWNQILSPRSLRVETEFPSAQVKKPSSSSDEDSRSSRKTVEHTPPKYAESTYEDAEEALDNIAEVPEESDESSTPSTAVPADEQKVLMGPQDPTAEELGYTHYVEDSDVESRLHDEYDRDSSPDSSSLDGQSEYFEAVPVMAERHEDREDAFDYENFFLHSAMGTYSRERRDSFSSEGSVETTRPPSPKGQSTALRSIVEASSPAATVKSGYGTLVEASPGLHRRSQSVDSISTVATFQTATEGENSDDGSDDGENLLNAVTSQLVSPTLSPIAQSPKRFVDSAVHIPPSDHAAVDLVNMEQHELAAALVSSLFGIEMNGSKDVPVTDVALVEDVLGSLQKVVTNLRAQSEDYDRRIWRRRLDAAKRALSEMEE